MKTTEKLAKGVTYKCSIIIKWTHVLDIVLLSPNVVFTMCDFNATPLSQTFSPSSLIKVSTLTYIPYVYYTNKELFRPSSVDRHSLPLVRSCFVYASMVNVNLLRHCSQRQRCRIHCRGVCVK